eukprot:gene4997-5113_t
MRTGVALQAAFVCALAAFARAALPMEKFRELLMEAKDLHQGGDFAAALRNYRAIIEGNGAASAGIQVMAGDACLHLGDMEDSLQYFSKALELEPGHATAMYNSALVLFRLERYEDARVACAALLDAHPNKPQGLHLMGDILKYGEGKMDAAPGGAGAGASGTFYARAAQ